MIVKYFSMILFSIQTFLALRESPSLFSSEASGFVGFKNLDSMNMKYMKKELEAKNISLIGFYHTSGWKRHWSTIISNQLSLMDTVVSRDPNNSNSTKNSAGLLSYLDKLHLIAAGDDVREQNLIMEYIKSLNLKFYAKLVQHRSFTLPRNLYARSNTSTKQVLRKKATEMNLTAGEYSSIDKLYSYCKEIIRSGFTSYVVYFHNKGSCCLDGPVADWRDEMNTFILKYPSICIGKLLEGYATCGVEYQQGSYSGNFWWANCHHIAALPGLWDPINNAYAAEFFIYNVSSIYKYRVKYGLKCGFNAFHCKVDHYHRLCPFNKYHKMIKYHLENTYHNLIKRNSNRIIKLTKELEYCQNVSKYTFKEQSTWLNGFSF